MNRFWGRNERGSVQKFTRDDDQILALNYENLCDGDYINRLFSVDAVGASFEEAPSSDSTGITGQTDNSLFSSELPEDFIIYGNDRSLGCTFSRIRFHKQLATSLKHQDPIASLLNRQSVVFEHIGKLMIERCAKKPPFTNGNKELTNDQNDADMQSSIDHAAAFALDCCLKMLDTENCRTLDGEAFEPLISMVFQISQEASLRLRIPTLKIQVHALSSNHVQILRKVLSQSAMHCLALNLLEKRTQLRAAERAFRTSLASTYGLLALALHTRNSSEILVSIAHLMMVILRAEEWYESFRAEAKAALGAALACAQPGPVAAEKATPLASSAVSSKVPLKVKNSADTAKNGGPKAPVKGAAPQLQSPPGPVVQPVSTPQASTALVLVPSTAAPVAPGSALNSGRRTVESSFSRLDADPVDDLKDVHSLVPSSLLNAHNNAHNNSNPNMKSWDSKPNSKLPVDKERDHAQPTRKSKNIRAEARVIQEILDPNMLNAQELSAYYANNPSAVNYVLKGNSNQGGEDASVAIKAQVSRNPGGGSGKFGKNNNNQPTAEDAGILVIDTSTQSGRQGQSEAPINKSSASYIIARHKKNMKDFKESLQSLLKIPKPMLKVLNDSCTTAATSDGLKGPSGASLLASNHLSDFAVPGPITSYVWSCGQNSYGELGLGDATMRKSFAKVSCLDDKRVVSIGAGNEHSLFVTQEGKLLTAGYNDNGQCGMGSPQQVRLPTVIAALEGEDIAQVHVYNGCEHTLAVTRDGKIFSFGYNYRGQLGLGCTSSEFTPRPIRGLLSRRVVLAACSYHHSIMLCADGSLFSCGRNDSGQLGHGDFIDKKTPQSVLNHPRNITSISCGQFHTVAATAAGVAYVCGKNDYGQLGIENSVTLKVFTELAPHPEIEQVVQVCCGYYHTLLLSNTGVVAGFGRNDYGQLGLGHAQAKVFSSTAIASLRDKGVRMVSAGCYHSVVTTANGMLYVFGRNNHGQLATGDQEERHSPHPVDDFVGHRILAVAAGFYHTIVLTAAGHSTSPVKASPSKGLTTSLGLNVADLVEPANAPLGLTNPLLNTVTGEPLSSAVSTILLKDVAHLTGIKSDQAANFIVPFAFDRKSRVSGRDLLSFLVTHVESLVTFTAPDGDCQSSTTAATVSRNGAASVQATSSSNSATGSIQWVSNLLCCIVSMLELCCATLEDVSGLTNLSLTCEEALIFLPKLIRMTGALLRENSSILRAGIEAVLKHYNSAEECEDGTGLNYIAELLGHDSRKLPPQPTQITTASILSMFDKCVQPTDTSNKDDDLSGATGAYKSMAFLRKKLLAIYFTLTPKEQQQNPKFQSIVTDIALCFAQSHALLLPTPALIAEFYTLLKDYTMPQITTNGITAFQQSLCVRMLTIFSATYRNSDEVVRLFQASKLDGLTVFRNMLSMYGHFSMHSLVKRFHSNKVSATSTAGGVHGGASIDIRRLVTVLEYCIANFVKCSIPIIFASASPLLTAANVAIAAPSRSEIFNYGVEIIKEVLADAVRLVDYVLAQSQSEEMLGQLRYGTIMPSILPSILIYGISFTRYRCLMLQIVPDVSCLMQKLQLIGKLGETSTKTATTTAVSTTGPVSSAKGGTDKRAHDTTGSSTAASAKEGEDGAEHADAFSEELTLSKRDPQQVSWWFRLIKLSNTFIAKMAAALLYTPPRDQLALPDGLLASVTGLANSKKVALIAHHNVWRFVGFTLNSMGSLSALDVSALLIRDLEQNRASAHVIKICATFREKEKSSDPVYKMLSQSTQSMFSTNLFHLIEESLLEAVMKLNGSLILSNLRTAQYFKLISRFTKRIHSRRSVLVTESNGLSWVEVLVVLNNIVKLFANLIVDGPLKIDHHVCLPLPHRSAEGAPEARLRARRSWRRVIMIVVCTIRWKVCWRLRMKQLAVCAIDFITMATSIVTNNFESIPQPAAMSTSVCEILTGLNDATKQADQYQLGLQTAQTLLTELSSNALRCDVLMVLIASLQEKSDHIKELFEADDSVQSNAEEEQQQRASCTSTALFMHPKAHLALHRHLIKIVTALNVNNTAITQHELSLLSHCMKFLQLSVWDDAPDAQSLRAEPHVSLSTIKTLLVQLRDKQFRSAVAAVVSAVDDKALVKKGSSNIRDRNAAYRRTSHDLLCYLQASAVQLSSSAMQCRPHLGAQMVDLHNYLITSFQLLRIETMKSDALNEEAARLSLEGKDSGSATTHAGILTGSSILTIKQQNKDGNRRRCQDLITKPMEFCRNVEGFVVLGEKLLNNYKGTDFTIACWVLIAKKSAAKHSFITGKVSHSDAWPIVLLRSDGKLDVLYGHNNEFEKITSVASFTQGVWAHLAVIVEQKKIKLFINGTLDCQVNTSKGNSRAVLFPLLVGCSPVTLRTKVAHVKEGFDGMLAQYKYYSRALSPIHVKVVFDNGPPETSDISGKLIYQMLASLKCLVNPINPAFIASSLKDSAGIMHMLFVTDTSRRTRFAALDVLAGILSIDAIDDMNLWSNWSCPSSSAADPQSVSLLGCSFLNRFATFRERLVSYFLRLAGACWAPHVLANLDNPNSAVDVSAASAVSLVHTAGSSHRSAETILLHGFLRFAPCLMTASDATAPYPYSLSAHNASVSMIDKLAAKKEERGEICFHVLKLLKHLSTVPAWSTAIATVLRTTFDEARTEVERTSPFSLQLKLDAIGCSLLLGGGSAGLYLGAETRNFFGDASGKIVNINKTTNFATLLCWNSLYAHQQIVKVRLPDLIAVDRQGTLSLQRLRDTSVTASVLGLLDALCSYVPVLLSDYMSSMQSPESALQRTLLKGMRPMEIFLFSQLLNAVSHPHMTGVSFSDKSNLLLVLQQAAVASLEAVRSEAQHHLGDNRAAYSAPSLSHLWMYSANFMLAVPEKVVCRPLLGQDEVKALCEFVAKNFSMSADSINAAPQARLLRQGRLGELVQILASKEGAGSFANKCETLAQQVEEAHESFSHLSETSGYVNNYLMSDWPPSFPSEWPQVSSDSMRNDLYCLQMLQLLHFVRKTIISNARTCLSRVPVGIITVAAPVQRPQWSREMVVWQVVLPGGSAAGVQELLKAPGSPVWMAMCESLYAAKRLEMTQLFASSLRYFSLTLLQINPFKSADNMFESLDLFKRLMHSTVCWVDFTDGKEDGEEVSVRLLQLLLPTLSFIDNSAVALQLTQFCMQITRKLAVKVFGGYVPSKELLEICKSNNFTLLRARAQEQMVKYKTHNMGDVSALAYNLTQLVSGLELIQRQGSVSVHANLLEASTSVEGADKLMTPPGSAVKASASSATKVNNTLQLAKIQSVETAAPKVTGARSSSVDADLTACAETVLRLPAYSAAANSTVTADSLQARSENVIVEVALGTVSGGSNALPCDCYFETVYCGASLRFVQSGLVPDCTYYLKCRAYFGAIPLSWSPVVEFKTQKGVLFSFDPMKCGPDIKLGEDGLTASYGNDDTWSTVLGNRSFSSGVTHWDIRINASSTAYVFVGVASSGADLSSFLGGCGHGWGFIGEQALYHNREKVKVYGESFTSGDIVGVTLDLNQGTMSFSRNHKSMGVAFDKIFGELYPAVAFYNVGQELEILVDGFKTTSSFETIPISPCRLNMDDISVLNELVLSLYRRHPLSHRLQVLVAEHCNQWCFAAHVRSRAVSGRDVFLATESALLKRFGFTVGERVRTPFGVAEVAGTAYNKVWFVMNAAGDVWYFTVQQILDGRAKKLFLRCSYDGDRDGTAADTVGDVMSDPMYQMSYDALAVQELLDPSKWSDEMDHVLLSFLSKQADALGLDSQWKVTSQQVTDNFRNLQQQFSRIMMDSHELSHRWGIAGPKRKAVLARIGLLRLLNQMLGMYLPFMVADCNSKAFALNQPTLTDDFAPLVVSLKHGNVAASGVSVGSDHAPVAPAVQSAWAPPTNENASWPLISLSWTDADLNVSMSSRELVNGPLHAIRRLIFCPMKMSHFWEVMKKTITRPAKTEDDYDYPDDLPHVKINRLKSFRAREASELLKIPGEDLMLSSMFCQLWRELRQHNDEKLRISYTHPMDDGQSRTFKIKFEGEGVDDYGGPYREIFQQICEELQSTDPSALGEAGRPSSWIVGEEKQASGTAQASAGASLASMASPGVATAKGGDDTATPSPTRCFLPLLMPTPNWTADGDCTERYRYMFHPAAESPLKMDLYHFLGQLVGIAVRSKITLDLALPSYIWKYVVCERLTEQDIASFDAPAANNLQRLGSVYKQLTTLEAQQNAGEPVDAAAHAMLQYNAVELIDDLTWSYRRSDGVEIELLEGKGQQKVELADVGRYLVLYAEARLGEGRNAIGMFRRGLVSILPESALSLLNWEELQAVVCGPRTIDVQRLKDNTEYDDDISPEDEHIVLFWEVLGTFSEAEKSAFLRFVWARPTLPPKGVEFSQKMRVLSAVGEDAHLKPDQYLPKAHTCFFSINLPKYSTKQLMTEKLLYAIFNCTEMDADFRTTESEVAGWGTAAAAIPADWQSTGSAEYN